MAENKKQSERKTFSAVGYEENVVSLRMQKASLETITDEKGNPYH